ncbi:methyltransferase type 12 [Silvimonas amylolytica]|uniref:Class I SAM-dependent methyltransferase n=1 Tax=Silvimonas amylolytica TaxID=449663 RepID=A0ABQ2PGK9_9NEIS|nr:methyltransferase type 12 [Silvimonas amylolytica]GGP24488.1 hypothetical protein GCM10010971_03070 [Silvimonas amylolytica]
MSQPLRFVLLQLLAVAAMAGFWVVAPQSPVWQLVLAGGILAATVAWFWHDGRWWSLIHLCFPAAVLIALSWQVPSWLWLVAFVVLFLFSAGAIQSRVPLYLSNQRTLALLSREIPPNAHLIDLGAGTGTVLAWLRKYRPDVTTAGVETALLPWLIGRCRLGGHADWRRDDAFAQNLATFDVVYAYLSPEPMPRLWQKVQAECRPGCRLISNSFGVPGHNPDKTIEIDDWKHSKLLIWQSI